MTTSDQDLLNAFSDLHVKLENNLEFEAHTGIYSADGVTWITDTPGKPGSWWVRRDSDGLQIACFNDAASKPDQPVICRWDTKTGIPTIVRVHNEKSPVYNPTAVPVSVPPISTGPGSGREQYNPASLISDGLVFARSGMTVGINPFAVVYQQSQNTYAPPDTDLTSYIPGTASTHCWAMVGYDPVTNAVQVVASTPIAVSMPLTQAQLSTIAFANYIPLAAVQLTNGQTTLQFPGQFVDRRPWITGQWWTMPLGVSYGGTGLATLPANLLLAGNGTNPLQSVTNGTAGQPLLAAAGLPAFSALALDGGATIVSGYGANRNVLISNGSQWQSRALIAADIPNLDASKITSGQLALAQGGTHADMSATGGAHFVVMQESASANLTVRALTTADMPSGIIVSPLTAKGDLWTYSSVDAKLAVGANNTVLVADSSATTGNKWSATLAGLTLTTPTIGDFTNATHTHQNPAGGGSLDAAAIGSGTLNNARVNWAAPGTLGSTTPNTVAAKNVTITSGGYIRPSLDDTGAILWTKADGTTVIATIDSTNKRLMLGAGVLNKAFVVSLGTSNTQVAYDDAGIYWTRTSDGSYQGSFTAARTSSSTVGMTMQFNDAYNFKDNSGVLMALSTSAIAVQATGNLSIPTLSSVTAINGVANSPLTIKSDDAAASDTGLVLQRSTRVASGTKALVQFQYGSTEMARITTAGNLGIGTSAPAALLHGIATDTGTSAVLNVAIAGHNTSGTPVANYGTGVLLQGQDSTTTNQNMARWRTYWSTATHASHQAYAVLSAYDISSAVEHERDVIGIGANGSAGLLGFYATIAAAPIVQPTTAIAAATFAANTSGIVNDTATWDSYTVGQVVKALRNLGILA